MSGIRRRLLGRDRWYERVGLMPARNKIGLMVMTAAAGLAGDVSIHHDNMGDEEGSVVKLGCADKQLLEELCLNLDAVDLGIEWVGQIRASSPLAGDIRGADGLAAASARFVEAVTAQPLDGEPSGASLAVVTERLGHAAASVQPPTNASRRARDALAAAYERLTAESAPF